MLRRDECLVSLVDRHPFAETDTVTYVARVLKKGPERWTVTLVTTASGEPSEDETVISVPASAVVSTRRIKKITPRKFYQMSESLTASGFVDKEVGISSRFGLGSGLQGVWIPDPELVRSFRATGNNMFEIKCENPYVIQDLEHDDSVTVASLATNNYLNKVLGQVNSGETDFFLPETEPLLTLWNIALLRTGDELTRKDLEGILGRYLITYLASQDRIQELPVNNIFRFLRYDSLLTTSTRLLRKCVHFEYGKTPRFVGDLE